MNNENPDSPQSVVTNETVEEHSVVRGGILFSIGDEDGDQAASDVTPNDEDHTTHQLFCEMDELQVHDSSQYPEWKEAARWVKFEEDVENGGRWSKPHVATLSLHSLFELRSCIFNGTVLLNLNCDDMDKIADTILEETAKTQQIDSNLKDYLKCVLLARHVHQHEKLFRKQLDNGETKQLPLIKSLAEMGKKVSHTSFLNRETDAHNVTAPTVLNASVNLLSISNNISGTRDNGTSQSFSAATNSQLRLNEHNETMKSRSNAHFMKKIPFGAEGANVLIGEVESLKFQLIAFIRLKKSVVLGDLTEVPVPTRFMFILLGPTGQLSRYHEIGRSMATLMSDDIFHDVCYKANDRNDLLAGLDDFLDQVTVLPPGEWHPNIRLDPPTKVLEKEERLELLAESTKKNNYSHNCKALNSEKISSRSDETVHEIDSTLERTGRFCGGLIADIKRKAPWYLSDFKDAFSFQCLSTIMFLYFACLSPIITFGGLLGKETDKNMASMESLLSGAICGVIYHMFAGQPMSILGSTGPVLVFESIVNTFCKNHDIDYMGFRCWIGVWIMIIMTVIVVTDTSFLVKFITRFTEESFAVLIAFIYIRESLLKLYRIKDEYAFLNQYERQVIDQSCYQCLNKSLSNQSASSLSIISTYNYTACKDLGPDFDYVKICKYVPDVFFFSVFLFIFTFISAMTLKMFKTTRFFPSMIRCKISDFGVVITIVCAVTLDYFVGLDTPKLQVPDKFETTKPGRGWFINPIARNGDKWWLAFAAIIPAILATILIFMDQQITAVIVNRRENKLKKGGGYHLDLLIVGICIGINSFLGIPWFVAATVLSINHVLSLKIESESSAPGEKPKFLGVVEQRVTGTVVFILIGCSVFMTGVLKTIPMPVLYAIFLYMGISSLRDIQFIQRLLILFMPEKYQPAYTYLRHVRTFKVHLFTFIQFSCLAMLFFIKLNKKISIIFPLMVLALVFIRKSMDYIFTQKELSYLDDIMPAISNKQKDGGPHDDDDSEINSDMNSSNSNNAKPFDIKEINISNELLKTSIWKQMNSENSVNEKKPKERKQSNKKAQAAFDESINMPLLTKDNEQQRTEDKVKNV